MKPVDTRTHASKTWTLEERDKNRLHIFDRQILKAHLAHYEPCKILGEHEVMVNLTVWLMEQPL
jgi:hypothetical protein